MAMLLTLPCSFSSAENGSSPEKRCFNVVSQLHKEGDVEAAVETAGNEMRRLTWSGNSEEVLDKVRNILKKEADKIPIITLNGFSFSNGPKEILDHWKETKEKKTAAISPANKIGLPRGRKPAVAVKKRR